MEQLQWDKKLATGIEAIDEQHERIVETLNELREAIIHHEFKAAEWALLQMVDYTNYHFEFEERLMERAGYARLPQRQRMHRLFIRHIPKFRQRYLAGEDVLREMHGMLARWLINHIQNDDRDYVPTIQAYLQREAQQSPAHYAPTEPMPLRQQRPAPLDDAARTAERKTTRGFWGRVSGFISGDDA